MKKKLLGVLLASFALVSVSQAKFYIGIEGGYSAQVADGAHIKPNSIDFSMHSPSTISDAFKKDKSIHGYSVGAVFGTEDFFGKYFGTRWGINAGYTSLSREKSEQDFLDVGLNLDLMLNFINTGSFSFGVFGGVSADYHFLLDGHTHFMDFGGRAGISMLAASHHRIELVAKLPMASMNVIDKKGKAVLGGVELARTTLGVSYKFVF